LAGTAATYLGRVLFQIRRELQTHIVFAFFISYKPIGASPGRDYEDGISTKNLVLNILYGVEQGIISKKGGNAPRATD
jgi:hypothetical protein